MSVADVPEPHLVSSTGEPLSHSVSGTSYQPIVIPSNFPISPKPLVATEDDVKRAKEEVPPGSSTLSGTMTTVTPAAAVVGLLSWWYSSRYGSQVPDAVVIYATILLTTVAHGIRELAKRLFSKVFA